jgi:aminoglycoside N3'-acetyltransferase
MKGMLELTEALLDGSLRQLGIESGDGLLVHSAIQMLGKPTDGIKTYVDVFKKVIGGRCGQAIHYNR